MSMVAVTFVDPPTGRELRVDELDDLMTVGEAVQNLVEQGFLRPAENGHDYHLHVKNSGVQLTNSNASLSSARLSSGDVIKVVSAQRGGR